MALPFFRLIFAIGASALETGDEGGADEGAASSRQQLAAARFLTEVAIIFSSTVVDRCLYSLPRFLNGDSETTGASRISHSHGVDSLLAIKPAQLVD